MIAHAHTTMPEVGERVTIARSRRLVRATVSFVLPRNGTTVPTGAWSAEPEDLTAVDDPSDATIHVWDIDPISAEGIGWARGWEGPEVDALRVAQALR